jgi:hypothetical protein
MGSWVAGSPLVTGHLRPQAKAITYSCQMLALPGAGTLSFRPSSRVPGHQ